MSITFKKQMIQVGGEFILADEIQLTSESEAITDICIKQLADLSILVPDGYYLQIYEQPHFEGKYICIYSDCDWLLLQQICSAKIFKLECQQIATVQFNVRNIHKEIRIPCGLYLHLQELNIPTTDYALILDDKKYKCERYSFGFQIYSGNEQNKLITIKKGDDIISIYKCIQVPVIQNNIFESAVNVQVVSQYHKLILFEKNNYEGAQLHIVSTINLRQLGNVGSMKICASSVSDKLFKYLKIQNYTQNEPKILMSLIVICSILIVVKVVIGNRVRSILAHSAHTKLSNHDNCSHASA